MKLTNSFAFKYSLLYLLVFFPVFGVFGYLMFKSSGKKILESGIIELQHKNDLINIQTSEYIEELISSLDYLSYNPVLSNFLNNNSIQNIELLKANYLSLLDAKKDFDQIRFISADTGKEIIRVERNNGQSVIVSDSLLQNKKDRPYFTETMNLGESDIFFSPIDLNKEFGSISLPKTPTLRLARPILYKGIKQGVLVININLKNLFANLKTTVGNNFRMRLLNEDGYYLMHEEIDSTYLFEYGINVVSKDLNVRDNPIIENDKVLKYYNDIQIPQMGYKLTSVVIAEKHLLLTSYNEWRNRSIWLMILTSLLLFLFSYLIMYRQSKILQKITDALKSFPKKRKSQSTLIKRKDEIGEMANSFSQMADLVNTQMDAVKLEKIKAENAVKEKMEFIENISHEIRNPLQSILGLNTMLMDNQPNQNQLDILESMKFNTTNLLGLVNNVLDYQNVLRGDINLNISWHHLPKLINGVIMGNRYAAETKGINIVSNIDDAFVDLEHSIDHLRLSQILGNLISNAIKFTPKGGKVSVCCNLVLDDNPQSIAFSVKDNGKGMTKAELVNVKNRYFSGKGIQSLESNHGIGLTIVSELLHLYGSELDISSVVSEGSEFSFVLRLAKREVVKSHDQELTKLLAFDLSMLIVEDDEQIINLYHHLLSDGIPNLDTINNVSDLSTITGKYDIIIADYRFSDKTLKDVHQDLLLLKKENTSLIIASATSQDITFFANDYTNVECIRKPFGNKDFIKVLNQAYLHTTYGYPDLDKIRRDYDYNQDKYRRAFDLLISEWESIMTVLKQAIETGDKNRYEATLHKFVTTLRRLDLDRLNTMLEDILNDMPLNVEHKGVVKNRVRHILEEYLIYIKKG